MAGAQSAMIRAGHNFALQRPAPRLRFRMNGFTRDCLRRRQRRAVAERGCYPDTGTIVALHTSVAYSEKCASLRRRSLLGRSRSFSLMMSIGLSNWRFSFDRSKGRSFRGAADCVSSVGREAVEVNVAVFGDLLLGSTGRHGVHVAGLPEE